MFEYEATELVGQKINKLMPDRYANAHDGYMQHYFRTGERHAIGRIRNVEGRKKSGLIFPISLRVEEKMQAGETVYYGEIHDLETSELEAIATTTADGTLRSCNRMFHMLFGYLPPESVRARATARAGRAPDARPALDAQPVGVNIRQHLPAFDADVILKRVLVGRMQMTAVHRDGSRFQVFVEMGTFTLGSDACYSLKITHTQRKVKQRIKALAGQSTIRMDLQTLEQYVGNYRLGKLIGSGTWGVVLLASHRLTGKIVAIKAVDNHAKGTTIEREVEILKLLWHPNICALYEVIRTPNKTFLVMEYCSGGELFDYVCQYGENGLNEPEARKYFRDVLLAVDYIHGKNVIHRDLKLENLLLDAFGNLKLIDFGMSNIRRPQQRMNTFCGSPAYTSPEIFMGVRYEGPEVDVWSLGVILFALVCGFLPFEEDPKLVLNGRVQLPSHVSAECRDLVMRMLERQPAQRITVAQIKCHPWLTRTFGEISQPVPSHASAFSDPTQLDSGVLQQMATFGFAPGAVLACIRSNSFNQITATYRFLEERKFESWRSATVLPAEHPPTTPGGVAAPAAAPAASTTAPSSYRCTKCGHLDTAAMAADAQLMAELRALLASFGRSGPVAAAQVAPSASPHGSLAEQILLADRTDARDQIMEALHQLRARLDALHDAHAPTTSMQVELPSAAVEPTACLMPDIQLAATGPGQPADGTTADTAATTGVRSTAT